MLIKVNKLNLEREAKVLEIERARAIRLIKG